jgi:hypothetical protein
MARFLAIRTVGSMPIVEERATLAGAGQREPTIAASCIGRRPGRCSAVKMEKDQIARTSLPACTVPDRLRWTSDFLNVASKAISIVACAKGLDYPPDLHRAAQQELRAWASYLEDHPSIAAEFELARAADDQFVTNRGSVGSPT